MNVTLGALFWMSSALSSVRPFLGVAGYFKVNVDKFAGGN